MCPYFPPFPPSSALVQRDEPESLRRAWRFRKEDEVGSAAPREREIEREGGRLVKVAQSKSHQKPIMFAVANCFKTFGALHPPSHFNPQHRFPFCPFSFLFLSFGLFVRALPPGTPTLPPFSRKKKKTKN